jgi:hypothetical protein
MREHLRRVRIDLAESNDIHPCALEPEIQPADPAEQRQHPKRIRHVN